MLYVTMWSLFRRQVNTFDHFLPDWPWCWCQWRQPQNPQAERNHARLSLRKFLSLNICGQSNRLWRHCCLSLEQQWAQAAQKESGQTVKYRQLETMQLSRTFQALMNPTWLNLGENSIHFTVALRHLGVIHDDSDLGWRKKRWTSWFHVHIADWRTPIHWGLSYRHLPSHLLAKEPSYAPSRPGEHCLFMHQDGTEPWVCWTFIEVSFYFMGLDLPASTRPLQKMLRLVKFLLHLQCFSSRAIRNCFDTQKHPVHARLLLLWLLGLRNNFHLNKLHRFGISQPLTLTNCWRLTLIVRIGLLGRVEEPEVSVSTQRNWTTGSAKLFTKQWKKSYH